MLAGVRPFTGETTSDVQAAILLKEAAPLPAHLPHRTELAQIINKCLHKNRCERYQTLDEFVRDTEKIERQIKHSQNQKLAAGQLFKQASAAKILLLILMLIFFATVGAIIIKRYS